jgi:hypothetical protein
MLGPWRWKQLSFDSLPREIDHVPASPIVSPVAFAVLSMLAAWRLSRAEII